MVNIHRITKIFERLDQKTPGASVELEFNGDKYLFLVAVLLSSRTTDKQVNKATQKLFLAAPNPQAMLNLGYDKLCEYISTVGLYKTKARNIIALSEKLLQEFNASIPDNREDLMSLPGIGKKSADVILSTIFKQPTLAVDTHVFRVSHRLGLSNINDRNKMSVELESKMPRYVSHELMLKASNLLVLHGRYHCKAIKPKCHTCPIADLCNWKGKSIAGVSEDK